MMLGKPLSALCSCSQFVRYFHQYFPLGIYCNVLGEATIPFCSYSSSPREIGKKNSVLSALQEKEFWWKKVKLLGASSYLTSHFDAQVSRLSRNGVCVCAEC